MTSPTPEQIEAAARTLDPDAFELSPVEWEREYGGSPEWSGQTRRLKREAAKHHAQVALVAAAGVTPQEHMAEIHEQVRRVVEGAMSEAWSDSHEYEHLPEIAATRIVERFNLAAPVQVDEVKLAEVINSALDAWEGEEPSEVFVARAIAARAPEWMTGGGR